MKQIYSLLLALAVPCVALAQAQITSANMPQVGDVYNFTVSYDDFNAVEIAAASGANQTWDFSDFANGESMDMTVVAASSTPFAAEFPGSNLAFVIDEAEYTFLTSTASSVMIDGIAFSGEDGVSIGYDNAELVYNLPFNHQTSFTDTYGGSGNIQGFDFTVDGDVTFTGDGYGTLILPSGTYPNCVRYSNTKTESITFLGFPSTTTINSWIWVSADHRYVVAGFEEYLSPDGGKDQATYTSYVRNSGPTSVIDVVADFNPTVYPNPVQANGTLMLDWDLQETVELTLMNLAGQIVFSDHVALNKGSNVLHPSIAARATGMYFLRVVDSEGASSVKRLVIR